MSQEEKSFTRFSFFITIVVGLCDKCVNIVAELPYFMIGTIVNTATIIVGGIIGAMLHRGIKEKYKEVLYTALGLASLAIGLNATISHFSQSEYPVLFIVSLAIGGVVGTALDIDGRFKRLVDKFSKQGETRRDRLADGLATAILLYCIGPLSMLGPVFSALKGDHTFLFTNATLDFVSSMVFASTYGIGMILAGRACSGWWPASRPLPSAMPSWQNC